jgi:hypothetical protein
MMRGPEASVAALMRLSTIGEGKGWEYTRCPN